MTAHVTHRWTAADLVPSLTTSDLVPSLYCVYKSTRTRTSLFRNKCAILAVLLTSLRSCLGATASWPVLASGQWYQALAICTDRRDDSPTDLELTLKYTSKCCMIRDLESFSAQSLGCILCTGQLSTDPAISAANQQQDLVSSRRFLYKSALMWTM